MGRRKIEMKMVVDSGSRQVTFSKRRSGLFKKANELATLCGSEVAIVVFSPGGKPFSFGHPSVEVVAERFLNQEEETEPDIISIPCFGSSANSKNSKMEKLNQQLSDSLKQLQIEKKKGEVLDKKIMSGKRNGRGKLEINDLGLDELEKLKCELKELCGNLKSRINDMEASSSLLLLAEAPVKVADKRVAKRA